MNVFSLFTSLLFQSELATKFLSLFQWSHQGHGGFNEVNVEEFMKTESGMDNMEYLYHAGGQGAGQNASPTMAHLPPPPHTPGSRPGDGGQYHHNLSNWVR